MHKLAFISLTFTSAALASSACDGQAVAASATRLNFTHGSAQPYAFSWSSPDEQYLTRLRTEFSLAATVAGATDDFTRVQRVSKWVRGRWEHNGENAANPADPISILHMAAGGERFRCVEYAIVLAAALDAIGIRSRVLGLKMRDVETRAFGAGHVVAEAYLADRHKWVMVDGQWDAIPILGGFPLSAVELQAALAKRSPGLDVASISRTDARAYFRWVAPYLYYFDTPFDQRVGMSKTPGSLMLVPVGAKNPTVFQRIYSVGIMTYTNDVDAFYAPPGRRP